ncbi:hypothetical protein [Winogradskyella sp. A2]|uniref:hypothetical protein n=1 Tax=Winogradskyella sp. A2 TaxID=3366944 RepID=UPI00398C567E
MLKQRRNRRFGEKLRFRDSDEKDKKEKLEARWDELRNNTNRRGNILTSLPFLIICLIALFVIMYILEGYI